MSSRVLLTSVIRQMTVASTAISTLSAEVASMRLSVELWIFCGMYFWNFPVGRVCHVCHICHVCHACHACHAFHVPVCHTCHARHACHAFDVGRACISASISARRSLALKTSTPIPGTDPAFRSVLELTVVSFRNFFWISW